MSPLEFINWWDLALLIAGVAVRMLVSLNQKTKQFDTYFSLVKYFDVKHVIRWTIHFFVALIGLLVFPNSIALYFPRLGDWSFLGSVILGFLGYDLVKVVEKITLKFFNKATS